MQAQVDQGTVMQKAQRRKQGESSSDSGIPLISRFPYSRLTGDQIIRLFSVYQITLGNSLTDSYNIIESIQQMDRCNFEVAIKNILGSSSQPKPVTVSLETFRAAALDSLQPVGVISNQSLQIVPYEYT